MNHENEYENEDDLNEDFVDMRMKCDCDFVGRN